MKNSKYIYLEEFITNSPTPSMDELKKIFNVKYFNYIKRLEVKKLGGII